MKVINVAYVSLPSLPCCRQDILLVVNPLLAII